MSDLPAQPVDDAKTTVLTLVDGLHFRARTPTGFTVDIDSRIEAGERAVAPSPMELQLVALGGCGAMDAMSILRKMRQDVAAYEVRLTYARAPEHPRVYTAVHIVHAVPACRVGRSERASRNRADDDPLLSRVRHALPEGGDLRSAMKSPMTVSGVVITGDVSPAERRRGVPVAPAARSRARVN